LPFMYVASCSCFVGMTSEVMPARFPPPWSAEEQEAGLVVRDHNEQVLACVYLGRAEIKQGTRSIASSVFLTSLSSESSMGSERRIIPPQPWHLSSGLLVMARKVKR